MAVERLRISDGFVRGSLLRGFETEEWEAPVPNEVGTLFIQNRQCGDYYAEAATKTGHLVSGFGQFPVDAITHAMSKLQASNAR